MAILSCKAAGHFLDVGLELLGLRHVWVGHGEAASVLGLKGMEALESFFQKKESIGPSRQAEPDNSGEPTRESRKDS